VCGNKISADQTKQTRATRAKKEKLRDLVRRKSGQSFVLNQLRRSLAFLYYFIHLTFYCWEFARHLVLAFYVSFHLKLSICFNNFVCG